MAVKIHAKPFAEFVKVPESCVHPGKRVWRIQNSDGGEQVLERLDDMPLAKLIEEPDDKGAIQRFWLIPSLDSGLSVGDQLVSVPAPGMRQGIPVKLLDQNSDTPGL